MLLCADGVGFLPITAFCHSAKGNLFIFFLSRQSWETFFLPFVSTCLLENSSGISCDLRQSRDVSIVHAGVLSCSQLLPSELWSFLASSELRLVSWLLLVPTASTSLPTYSIPHPCYILSLNGSLKCWDIFEPLNLNCYFQTMLG